MSTVDPNVDPTRIKALAHPIRLALIDYLGSVSEATATQCAAAINESVASCSFHLRTLAKHGYIEQAEAADAKSKPWRLSNHTRSATYEPENPETLGAISELGTAIVAQISQRINEFLAAAPSLPPEAIDRSILANKSLWLTHEEHEELITKMMDLCDEYRIRNTEPDTRPEGAQRSRLFIASTPDLAAYERNTTER